jgi:hypothetical protein
MNQLLLTSSNVTKAASVSRAARGKTLCLVLGLKALAASAVFAEAVFAETGVRAGQGYLGASVQSYDCTDRHVSDISPNALRLQAGTQLSDQLAIEAHYGVGLGEEMVNIQGGAQTLEIDHFRAFYIKPLLLVNPQVSAYGLLGYAEAQILMGDQAGVAQTRFREYGASYGFGAQLQLNPYSALNIEYLRLLDETDLDASSLGVGINMEF